MRLLVESLQRFAMDGNMVGLVIESCSVRRDYGLDYENTDVIKFHVNNKVIFLGSNGAPFTTIAKLQNMFEKAYQGVHLEVESLVDNQCIFVIKKNDIESLQISEDYTLVTEKMGEVKEIRKLTEESLDIQKKSLTYINDLYNKLVDVREYAKQLQLREENEKKVSEQLESINSDIKELEIRLKKDIPELSKNLDINNFR